MRTVLSLVTLLLSAAYEDSECFAQQVFPIAQGWARTKVNTVIFRRSAVCSFGIHQVAAFYDAESRVVLARRVHGSSDWDLTVTPFKGRTADAHNSISIAFDGEGRLHMSWDHHGSPLHYCRSLQPGALEMGPMEQMTGNNEQRITYPEFYLLPDGDLLFFCRDGSSGNGNLMLNRYDTGTRSWSRVQDNLIDGEGSRNAYWQVAVDRHGHIFLSWVWRETGDVVTNHDLAFASSTDKGVSWRTTTGDLCTLPITEQSAEYAARIPQNSELANQTSMAVDYLGNPVIASFWRDLPDAVPQYRLVYHDGSAWNTREVGHRTLNFHRKGGGTKRPPISRPLLLLDSTENRTRAFVLFRDLERGGGITVAGTNDIKAGEWSFKGLTDGPVGQSDPLVDPAIWNTRREIHVLTQFVGQGDFEKQEDVPPQMVSVIEWRP